MIHCLFRLSTDAGYIKLIVEILSTAPEAAGRNFPFSSLIAHLLGFSFGFGPSSGCRSPEGILSSLREDRLKEQLICGLWLTQATGREGYGYGACLRQQWPTWRCHSLRCSVCSPGEVVPGSQDPGSGRLHRLREGRCGYWPVLAHRLLGGCSSSLSVPCPSLGSALIAAARAHLWSSFKWHS